jgi:hypothetical protein
MDERDMEQEGQNGKRKVCGIERNKIFNCYFYYMYIKQKQYNNSTENIFYGMTYDETWQAV